MSAPVFPSTSPRLRTCLVRQSISLRAWRRKSRTALPHFSISALRKAVTCSGVSPTSSAPSAARRSRTSGIAIARTASPWIFVMISRGVPAGTDTRTHDTTSKPLKPCSSRVADFRGRLDALERSDAEPAHAAVLHVRQRRHHVAEVHLDVSAHDIGERGRGALVGDVHHLDAGRGLEDLGREVLGAPDPRGSMAQRIGARFRERDELLRVLRRHRWMHHDHARQFCDVRDVREVAHDIEIELGKERHVDGVGDGRREQRVAVRRRSRGEPRCRYSWRPPDGFRRSPVFPRLP